MTTARTGEDSHERLPDNWICAPELYASPYYGTKTGDRNERQRTDEHAEAAARTEQRVQPEISSPSWRVGEGTVGYRFNKKPAIFNDGFVSFIKQINRAVESVSG